jgi:mycofactocin precursor
MSDATIFTEPEPVLEESAGTTEEPVVEDLVIEELSIDGMCGVY